MTSVWECVRDRVRGVGRQGEAVLGACGVIAAAFVVPAALLMVTVLFADRRCPPGWAGGIWAAATLLLMAVTALSSVPAVLLARVFNRVLILTTPELTRRPGGRRDVLRRLAERGVWPVLARELPLPVQLAMFLPDLSPLRSRLLAAWWLGHFLVLAGVLLLVPSPFALAAAGNHRLVLSATLAHAMLDVAATVHLFLALAAYRRDWRTALSLWRYRAAFYAGVPAAALVAGRVLFA